MAGRPRRSSTLHGENRGISGVVGQGQRSAPRVTFASQPSIFNDSQSSLESQGSHNEAQLKAKVNNKLFQPMKKDMLASSLSEGIHSQGSRSQGSSPVYEEELPRTKKTKFGRDFVKPRGDEAYRDCKQEPHTRGSADFSGPERRGIMGYTGPEDRGRTFQRRSVSNEPFETIETDEEQEIERSSRPKRIDIAKSKLRRSVHRYVYEERSPTPEYVPRTRRRTHSRIDRNVETESEVDDDFLSQPKNEARGRRYSSREGEGYFRGGRSTPLESSSRDRDNEILGRTRGTPRERREVFPLKRDHVAPTQHRIRSHSRSGSKTPSTHGRPQRPTTPSSSSGDDAPLQSQRYEGMPSMVKRPVFKLAPLSKAYKDEIEAEFTLARGRQIGRKAKSISEIPSSFRHQTKAPRVLDFEERDRTGSDSVLREMKPHSSLPPLTRGPTSPMYSHPTKTYSGAEVAAKLRDISTSVRDGLAECIVNYVMSDGLFDDMRQESKQYGQKIGRYCSNGSDNNPMDEDEINDPMEEKHLEDEERLFGQRMKITVHDFLSNVFDSILHPDSEDKVYSAQAVPRSGIQKNEKAATKVYGNHLQSKEQPPRVSTKNLQKLDSKPISILKKEESSHLQTLASKSPRRKVESSHSSSQRSVWKPVEVFETVKIPCIETASRSKPNPAQKSSNPSRNQVPPQIQQGTASLNLQAEREKTTGKTGGTASVNEVNTNSRRPDFCAAAEPHESKEAKPKIHGILKSKTLSQAPTLVPQTPALQPRSVTSTPRQPKPDNTSIPAFTPEIPSPSSVSQTVTHDSSSATTSKPQLPPSTTGTMMAEMPTSYSQSDQTSRNLKRYPKHYYSQSQDLSEPLATSSEIMEQKLLAIRAQRTSTENYNSPFCRIMSDKVPRRSTRKKTNYTTCQDTPSRPPVIEDLEINENYSQFQESQTQEEFVPKPWSPIFPDGDSSGEEIIEKDDSNDEWEPGSQLGFIFTEPPKKKRTKKSGGGKKTHPVSTISTPIPSTPTIDTDVVTPPEPEPQRKDS